LSLLDVSPPELVRLAASSGFDFVGIRVLPVTQTEPCHDLRPGSALLGETLAALDETGLEVRDVEFLLLDGSDQRDVWRDMMRAGQALEASTLTVASALPESPALAETLQEMAADGREWGIRPTLEMISYQGVSTMASAVRLAEASGCGLLGDTLHLTRTRTSPSALAECAEFISMLQICDGTAAAPADRHGLIAESRGERLVPGEGDFDIAQMIAALPDDVPVSVEVPSSASVERLGHDGWASVLRRGAERVLREVDHG
jgi:sugar phosphate isomerase/epimerase